ncbi:MAG: hypothetical protein CFE26_00285 [Verrucomicrobiales bacterium VVV1]|nr:MAG: hypothetical protein CFE26_00285 [Verrucomicrobiales bacterium VVV1]
MPDEDLESTLLEEPLPERDFLLETLVDAETEAKPRRRFSKTLIAACVLSGLGIWQIVDVSNGGEPIFQLAPKPKAAPTKQRSEGRESIGRVLQSTDPIAAYLERAKRGMTDQEIRWLIEDFQTAGLDQVDRSLKGTLRAKQQAWYLEALTEALQLRPEQKDQARARMDELLKKDLEAFEQGIAGVTEVREPTEGIPNESPIAPYADATTWLLKDAYAPWNLCDLSAEQSQLTLQRWKEAEKEKELKKEVAEGSEEAAPFSLAALVFPEWVRSHGIAMQDPTSGNIIEYPPPSALDLACTMPGTARGGMMMISDIIPLTPDQKLADHRYDVASQARLLQPAQLRVALLLTPILSNTVTQQLDRPPPQASPIEGPGISVEKAEEPAPNAVEPKTPVDPEELKAVE